MKYKKENSISSWNTLEKEDKMLNFWKIRSIALYKFIRCYDYWLENFKALIFKWWPRLY